MENMTYNEETKTFTFGDVESPTMVIDTINHSVMIGDPIGGSSVLISSAGWTIVGSAFIDAGLNPISSVAGGTNPFDAVNLQQMQDSCVIPTSGSGAPTSTPTMIGAEYVDTLSKTVYFATGTSSASDWTAMN